jgi:hypothetical protein
MRRPRFALELFILAFGLLPFGVASAVYWLTTGKVPHWLVYALIAIITGCVIAGIEKRIESRRGKDPKTQE